MPKRVLPRIVGVSVGNKPFALRVDFDNGATHEIDVAGHVQTFALYAPLRRSPALYSRVRVGEGGADAVWSDEIDISADTLWRLAREQSGATMSAQSFRDWRSRNALTLDAAAKALGVSRRMVAYYEEGGKPVPRVVALATRALEMG